MDTVDEPALCFFERDFDVKSLVELLGHRKILIPMVAAMPVYGLPLGSAIPLRILRTFHPSCLRWLREFCMGFRHEIDVTTRGFINLRTSKTHGSLRRYKLCYHDATKGD